MLEQLFGSTTRLKLMYLLLINPEQKYYVRELTRQLNSQINAVRRELKNLQEIGILREVAEDEEIGNSKCKFYQADAKFVLYPELKSILQKSHFLLEKKFAKSLQKLGKVYYLALTGNFVGEKNVPTDMLIVGRLNKRKVINLIKKFEQSFNQEINYTIFDRQEFDYRRSVADRFLYSVLDAEKIVLIDEIFSKLQIQVKVEGEQI